MLISIYIEFTVFSTYVEVILNTRLHMLSAFRILHVCGGDPRLIVSGCGVNVVFSTYVEVILFAIANC